MTARSPEGYAAAEYDLNTPDGDLGEAKVWSRGAYRAPIHGETRTVIHVGFALENHTNTPFTLAVDDVYLDSAMLDEQLIRDVPPASIEGAATVPARADQIVNIQFAMPRGVSPDDLDAFRVRWRVDNSGLTYSQRTPFMERPETERYASRFYYTPFYDPFYYDPYIFHPRIVVHDYPYRHHHVFR